MYRERKMWSCIKPLVAWPVLLNRCTCAVAAQWTIGLAWYTAPFGSEGPLRSIRDQGQTIREWFRDFDEKSSVSKPWKKLFHTFPVCTFKKKTFKRAYDRHSCISRIKLTPKGHSAVPPCQRNDTWSVFQCGNSCDVEQTEYSKRVREIEARFWKFWAKGYHDTYKLLPLQKVLEHAVHSFQAWLQIDLSDFVHLLEGIVLENLGSWKLTRWSASMTLKLRGSKSRKRWKI